MGSFLYLLHARIPLTTIDTSLADLKERARPVGEVIAYLPAESSMKEDLLSLDVLLASREGIAAIESAMAGLGVTIDHVPFVGEEQPEPAPLSAPPPAPPAPQPPPEPEPTAPASPSVRVDLKKLDDLLDAVGELSSMRAILTKIEAISRSDPKLRDLLPELETLRRTFDRRRAEVQARVLDVRMVPLAQVFERLARLIRQTAREQNKEVNLIVTGADTEVDKLIAVAISDPLLTLVRHVVEHGIEDRDARVQAGKPIAGTIAINAYVKGDRVMLDIEDDGRGRVRTLDAMKPSVAKVGGTIETTSERGVGERVTLALPVSLAIMTVLVVEVFKRLYCLPLTHIEAVTPFEDARVRRTAVSQRGVTIPIVWLSGLFGDHAAEEQPVGPDARLVIARVADRRVGFVVDRVDRREDIVVKRLGRSLRNVTWLLGAAAVADQRLGFVVDLPVLVDEVLATRE